MKKNKLQMKYITYILVLFNITIFSQRSLDRIRDYYTFKTEKFTDSIIILYNNSKIEQQPQKNLKYLDSSYCSLKKETSE